MTNKWQFIRIGVLAVFLSGISGCALTPDDTNRSLVFGEHVAYRVVNLAGASVLEMPTLTEAGSGQVLFSTLSLTSKNPQRPKAFNRYKEFEPSPAMLPIRMVNTSIATTAMLLPDVFGQDPGDENLSLPPASINASSVMPNGHRIPNIVALSWRQSPRPGQAAYQGDKGKPIELPVRARIPVWVLSQIRDQWRYRLDLDVVVNGQDSADLRWRVLCFNDGSLHEIARGGKWH